MFNAELFLIDFDIKYEIEKKGWVNINCPFCDNNKNKKKGGINIFGKYFNCWNCGGNSLEYMISELLLIPLNQTKGIIQEYTVYYEIVQSKKEQAKRKRDTVDVPGESLKKLHRNYLFKRGFDPEYIVDKYNVKGTMHYPNPYEYRLIIPIYYKNRIISFQARDVTNRAKLRYLGLKEEKSIINYKNTLYGLDFIRNDYKIGIVEGIFDQWKMGDGFVASFGTSLTDDQIKLLSNFDNVFFLFDSGKEAQNRAKEYATKLAVIKKNVEFIDLQLDGNRDPGDLNFDEVYHIRRELGF